MFFTCTGYWWLCTSQSTALECRITIFGCLTSLPRRWYVSTSASELERFQFNMAKTTNRIFSSQTEYGQQLTAEILFSTTTNGHGIFGKGKPTDLEVEHRNKVFKDIHCPQSTISWLRIQTTVAGYLRNAKKEISMLPTYCLVHLLALCNLQKCTYL